MKRKSVPSFKWQTRHHRYAASFRVHYPRPPGGHEEEEAAARAISGGDYFVRSLFREDINMIYLFRTADQAHAMQIWFEANARPYDDWEERVLSWEKSARDRKALDDMINAAAATGALDRLRPAWDSGDRRAAASLLREIEPDFDAMQADRVVALLFAR